jgi:small-conductance mechanosensitive channel
LSDFYRYIHLIIMVFEQFAESMMPYGDIAYALWVMAMAFLGAKSVFFIFKTYVARIKKQDKPGFGDHVASEVKGPLYLIAVTIGLYYALTSLRVFEPFWGNLKDYFVLVIVLMGVYISRKVISALILWYSSQDRQYFRIEKTALYSLKNLISLFIYAIAILILLNEFGIEITPLLASLGIGGLAIALALQPTLTNYFAGMYMASDKTARLGDFIELDSEKRGYVEKMTWRSVWMKTLTNNTIVIPNSKLAESTIMNYSQPKQPMLIKVPVGVAYGSDLDKVEKVTLKVAKRLLKKTGSGVDGEEPFIRFREFGDSNIKFNVLFKIKRWERQYELIDEFIKALKKEFDKEKIEIAFPCRNIYTR